MATKIYWRNLPLGMFVFDLTSVQWDLLEPETMPTILSSVRLYEEDYPDTGK